MDELASFAIRTLNLIVPNRCSIHLGMLSRSARLQLSPARSGEVSPVRIVAQNPGAQGLGLRSASFLFPIILVGFREYLTRLLFFGRE
jgi:hypothetical protein